jgi:hypothetical protein
VRLHLVAHTNAHREFVVHANVILPVETQLVLIELGVHLPIALRERCWQPGIKCLETAERECPGVVLCIEVAVPITLEQHTDPHLVLAPEIEIKVVGQLEPTRR